MKLSDSLASARTKGAVVSIGNFDGVHLGHRALLGRMRGLARDSGRPALVVTFFPPAKVLFTGADYLSSAAEKRMLLSEFTPDEVVTIPFDRDFASTEKQAFVARLAALEPSAIVVGRDFRFGHDRQGTVADLADIAPLEPFDLVTVDGRPVGSSRIRELLAANDVEGANRLLGAPYPALGTVVHGAERGRTIGYPTANLQLAPGKALPTGVFVVTAVTAAGAYGGMANVGARPSFAEEPPSLEVHLFDFTGDLYEQEIAVQFHRRLRDQRRFDSLAELKEQLARDADESRATLARLG